MSGGEMGPAALGEKIRACEISSTPSPSARIRLSRPSSESVISRPPARIIEPPLPSRRAVLASADHRIVASGHEMHFSAPPALMYAKPRSSTTPWTRELISLLDHVGVAPMGETLSIIASSAVTSKCPPDHVGVL